MWKRFNNKQGAHPTMSIGDPILQDTTLDSSHYPGLDLSSGSQSPPDTTYNSYLPPPRPSRMETKGLPSLPFEAQTPSPDQESSWRPASSVYSKAPLPHINTRMPRDSYATVTTTYTEDDISPPSSPDLGAVRRHRNANAYDDGVSPIDETDMSQFENRRPASGHTSRPGSSSMPASNIPVLRRENKQNQVKVAAANLVARKQVGSKGRPTQDPRWDPYSGEITTSDKGKPQSVKPGQFTAPTLKSTHDRGGPILGNESNVSAAPKAFTSFTDRVRKLKMMNAPAEKPGWKGASGRVTLVNPVEDQPDLRPMNIPRKSSRRVASPDAVSPVSAFRRDETGGQSSPLSSHPMNQEQEYITRAVLANSVSSSPRSASPDSIVQSPSPISIIHDPLEVSSSPPVDTQDQSYYTTREVGNIPRSDTDGTIIRNFREALAESFPESKDKYEQPSSKFSFTTYAPSEPRQSIDTWEQPEMPVLPPQAPSPILNRKRPQVLGDEPRMPRKAIPSSSPVFISMNTSVTRKRESQISILSKNLPQSPAEAQSNDLISSLQAQIENLQHRRNQIVKSIKQMTELMPQDRITITQEVRLKREAEKRKVEALREEEADIRKEEHELGLKLHRAYKRKDKDAIYEPTTLWVRRVTG